jgi:aldose 1-epimerase
MSFRVRNETRTVSGSLDPTVYILEDAAGTARAEVWPALGFNCYRWHVVRAGVPLELLYTDPALFGNGRPTRSGVPILFPFPNRIRDGKFTWDGKEYSLPLNDPVQKNAAHGFACRKPWRVIDHGGNADGAWITGAFRLSIDDPDSRPHWPADCEITITYELSPSKLRVEAVVTNPDTVPLPFGLGYHPYFRLPFTATGDSEACKVEVPAQQFWELEANLPTGKRLPVDASRDLNTPRKAGELHLDDVLTGLPTRHANADGLIERGTVWGADGVVLKVLCSPDFHEMVAFNPAHRQAFCIEPYTCVTDAVNLRSDEEAGWFALSPGGTWKADVEFAIS